MTKILMTGGNGRLGQELRILMPSVIAPSSHELDVTDWQQIERVLESEKPDLIVHAAAYTNVGKAEEERAVCWKINVEGTRNMARAANLVGAKLVHISTDYVFSGETGNYNEEDTPGPVANYYSLTKLVAEEAARAANRYLIIRTSFRPREFQYPIAFSDMYTSQDYVDIIAPMVAQVITNSPDISDEVLHVATERKSVYELAQRRSPNVAMGNSETMKLKLPKDTSLDTHRWRDVQKIINAE